MARAPNGSGEKFITAHVAHHSDDCLLWPNSLCSAGYPSCMVNGKLVLAHRHMCKLAHGEPPTRAHHAAHSCGNRRCINPKHLSWKTPSENQIDRNKHGTSSRGRYGILTPKQVLQIRHLRGRDTAVSLASRFGVTESNVRHIFGGKIWKNVQGS